MHNHYFPEAYLNKSEILIKNKKDIHHLNNVLRLKKDTHISIFDGSGLRSMCKIMLIDKSKVILKIISTTRSKPK